MSGFSRYAMNAQAARESTGPLPIPEKREREIQRGPAQATWDTVARSWKKAARAWAQVERELR